MPEMAKNVQPETVTTQAVHVIRVDVQKIMYVIVVNNEQKSP